MFHLTPINHLLDTSKHCSKEEATQDTVKTVFSCKTIQFFGFIQIFDFQSAQTFWITLYFLAPVPEAPERRGGIQLIQDMNVLILHF